MTTNLIFITFTLDEHVSISWQVVHFRFTLFPSVSPQCTPVIMTSIDPNQPRSRILHNNTLYLVSSILQEVLSFPRRPHHSPPLTNTSYATLPYWLLLVQDHPPGHWCNLSAWLQVNGLWVYIWVTTIEAATLQKDQKTHLSNYRGFHLCVEVRILNGRCQTISRRVRIQWIKKQREYFIMSYTQHLPWPSSWCTW